MASVISAGTTSGTSLNLSGDTSGVLQLASNGSTTAVTIDTSQKVGIGTTSPTGKLHVYGSGEVQTLQRSSGSANNYTLFKTESGADQAYLGFSDAGVNDFAIYNVQNGYMRFATNNTERMRIGSSGQLFYNCTAEPSSSVKGWGLFLTGSGGSTGQYVASATTNSGNFDHYYFYSVNGLAGFIRTNGTTCTYNSVSDARLKDNIVDAPSALDVVDNIKVRSFDWKTGNGHVDYGFVAQELNDVAPQAVAEGENTEEGEIKTPWAVDSSMLVPMLAKAIQELNAKVEAQSARIAELEGAK